VIKERDNKKKELTTQQGISLIVVPYWWDKTLSR